MTDDEIAALRAAAAKAADAEEDWYGAEYLEGALHRPPQDIDATYIAAASPAAVLALLDEREALRAALRSIDRRDTYNADSYGQFAQIARAALARERRAMTDAWDGRPQNPERDGWHWVRVNLAPAYQPEPWFWDATSQAFALDDRDDDWFPQHYDYLGPALLPAQVAAAVEAEREAIADEHDCGCAARIDVLRMLSSGTPWRAKNFCPAAPNCCAIDAAAIRARGPSSALADALRQAEARGMREAAMHALSAVPQPLVGDAGHCTISTRDICAAAILAADAKEKPDAK